MTTGPGFASFAGSDVRAVQAGQKVSSDGSSTLNGVVVGLSYQFSEDDETAALICFARLTLVVELKQKALIIGRMSVLSFSQH